MDGKPHLDRRAGPQLLVKIVGGKQIKQFIDPNRTKAAVKEREGSSDEEVKKTLGQTNLELLNPFKNTESANVHAALTQAPDRVCVTAPSGERTHSYIHLRRPAASNPKHTPARAQFTQQGSGGSIRQRECEDWLCSAVCEELIGWQLHTLQNIREESAALDSAHTGCILQSELTYLFLRWQVPLRLPTLASLLHTFSSPAHPEQVLYEDLLQFIQNLDPNQEADIWKACPELGDRSDGDSQWTEDVDTPVDPGEAETWLQRFHKMESAVRLCDSQNTGYIEKELARRLILNYSQIFNLNLSPFRISEVMRDAQLQGRVHLLTALELLKRL